MKRRDLLQLVPLDGPCERHVRLDALPHGRGFAVIHRRLQKKKEGQRRGNRQATNERTRRCSLSGSPCLGLHELPCR